MTEMVERVARAIWDEACPGMEWGLIDKMSYCGWAREAIKAMREPTQAMIDAGVKSRLADDEVYFTHKAMIDEALK